MKLIWLSDIHLKPKGELLYGYDTVQRLSHAVNYITTQHPDADYCFISGDLVDAADALSYQSIKTIMAGLSMPVLTIPGNHDDRNLMKKYLSFPENCHADFLQYSVKKKAAGSLPWILYTTDRRKDCYVTIVLIGCKRN